MRAVGAATALAGLFAVSCASLSFDRLRGRPACVAEWPDSDSIPDHTGQHIRFATQPLSAAPGEQRVRGEIVTSAARGELTIVGLTPFGTRAFSAVQKGRRVRLDAGISRRLGLEPYYLMDALHRGVWPSLPAGSDARVRSGEGGSIDVESRACGYRTRLLVLPKGAPASGAPVGLRE